MNVKNTDNISFIFLSFLKRLLVVSLAIIISFNTVCKPKETHAIIPLFAGILAVAGAVCTVTGAVIGAKTIIDWFSDNKDMDENEVVDYFNQNVSVDGDGNYLFSDDAKLTINQMFSDYKDSVTMVYKYPFNVENLDASQFASKSVYDELCRVILANPNLYFVYDSVHNYGYYEYTFYVYDNLNACVGSTLDLPLSTCNVYDDEWSMCNPTEVILYGNTRSDGLYWKYWTGSSYSSYMSFEDISFVRCNGSVSAKFINTENIDVDALENGYVYSSHSGGVSVYKSLADMKKDLSDQVVGKYTENYSGEPNFNITTSEVNNIVNNYYPSDPDDDSGGGSGSGSGSDDSGGSSSGGSGIIDGLGKLFGAIGNIIDKLFGFVLGLLSKVVDFFGSILEMFTDTLTNLIDVIPSGFNEFLAAMFPYIPEEWITIAEFILLVSAIGCVVALFKR